MIAVGIFFIYLAVAKEFEPMLLIPIGFGMLVGNIPFNMEAGLQVGIYEQGSVLQHLISRSDIGMVSATHLPRHWSHDRLLGIDFNPKLMLIGAAAQFGIFGAYMIALEWDSTPCRQLPSASSEVQTVRPPSSLSSKLAPNLMGAIAVSAYSYMALVPVIQPPIMRLLTTKKERLIRMKAPRRISYRKVLFPIMGLLLTCFLVPSGLPAVGYAVLR